MRRFLPVCLWLGLLPLLVGAPHTGSSVALAEDLTPVSSKMAVSQPDHLPTWQQWIDEMKQAPRGPFQRIRWFCRDGTVQPPVPYACRGHGGGVQHGEWNTQTQSLRNAGYHIANVLAEIKPHEFLQHHQAEHLLKQILLEQFLIEADDGWILRRARYYRGALQAEDEAASGQALLHDPSWRNERFLVLREAVRLLPHGREGAPLTAMRELSKTIAEQDRGFEPLRIKLHVRPEPTDTGAWRNS